MKAKTHSGSKKRVKITGTGKFTTNKIGKRHLLQNKSAKAKGKGKYGGQVHIANERKMKVALQVQGKRTPAKKKPVRELSTKVKAPKVIKAAAPKKAPAPKKTATPKKTTAPKSTKKKAESTK